MIVRNGVPGVNVEDVGTEDKPPAALHPETSRRLHYMQIAASYYAGTSLASVPARTILKLAKELWLEDVADGIWELKEED